MPLYWNIKEKCIKELEITEAAGNNNLITVYIKNSLDRRTEIPICESNYIKIVDNFPVEMTVEEKEVVDAELLAQAKEAKIEEIKIEAQRRVLEENEGNEIGIGFIHMTEHDQRNALALCLATVKAALDTIHGMDILSVLPQQQQDVYRGIEAAWGIIVTIRGISDAIELDVANAETIEEVEAIPVKDNDKWIIS